MAEVDSKEQLARLAEAVAWRVRLTETEAESCVEFEAWLDDPANEEAWAKVQRPWNHFAEKATAPEIMAARRDALDRARSHAGRKKRQIRWAAAACFLIAAIGGGTVWQANQPDLYQTALGERRVITLADGSSIALDSGTEVQVRYTKDTRRLELVRGQARFDVAHDVQRPFSVHAKDRTVVAVGTAFNVDLLGPNVMVTLIEGQVTILDDQPLIAKAEIKTFEEKSVQLKAGQRLVAKIAFPSTAKIETADIVKVTAWESGQLMFDNEPLSAVISRVNRYSAVPIAIEDSKLGDMRISGVFNTGDISGFVDTITHYLPISAAIGGGRIALKLKS